MIFNSIRFKISVLYTSILGLVLVIFSALMYFSLSYTLYSDLDAELATKVEDIDRTMTSYLDSLGYTQKAFLFSAKRAILIKSSHPDQALIADLEKKWLRKADKYDLRFDIIKISDLSGKNIVSSGNLGSDLEKVFAVHAARSVPSGPVFANIRQEKRDLRLISMRFGYRDRKEYLIQAATSLKPIMNILKRRLYAILAIIGVILLFSSFLGLIFAKRILDPVMKITTAARKISHENLTERVSALHVDTEMRYLVDAFNSMIERLERSFRYIMEFSMNVAHELKTPLAIIRGESEIALRKERTGEDYRSVIRSNLEESKRILSVIDDLLFFTKVEYRPGSMKLERMDLVPFIKELYEQAVILGSSRSHKILLEPFASATEVMADELHLRRLFYNLIHNAVKFCPDGGTVAIKCSRSSESARVAVSDTGPGIRKEDMGSIFKKFFHADPSGKKKDTGTGLGLNIALSIALAHNGSIEAASDPGRGAVFTVTLPLA